MADVGQVLHQSLPEIDNTIAEYLHGVLDDGGEFDDSDDVYDAFGEMLHQVDDSKSEDEIRDICTQLYNIIVPDGGGVGKSNGKMNGQRKVLGAPVVIKDVKIEQIEDEAGGSVWLSKRDNNLSTVDKKKLEKAEAKIQMKKDRRDQIPVTIKKVDSGIELASASQQINRRDAKMDAAGTNKSLDIKIENFDVAFGERVLLSNADLHLVYGRRYGFIGRNGLGKTTLLKMISSAQLKIPSHISILHVEQEVVGDNTAAIQSVLECDTKRENLLKQERELNAKLNTPGCENESGLSNKLSEVYQELAAIEADRAPAKAAVIMAGLGFHSSSQERPTKEFSGGWRMRLALARALFTKPDLLLLDEPTNMLDMKAIIWLENYLQTWESTILVVSHDRLFLNSVSTDIIHLQSKKLDTYRGDYEVFKKTREERLKNQMREYEAQKDYREHIQIFIDRFRYNANRAAQVQSKLKILEKLPPLVPIEKEPEVILRFPECESLSPPILQLDEVEFYYNKAQPIFKDICVNSTMTSRICIVGENGAGKTTLLKILLGELSPVSGLRNAHRSLRIGYFSQHHVDQLEMNMTSVEVLAARFPGKPVEQYRTQLGSFGVSGELAMRPVSSLSGGQKSRVAFAVMSLASPNFFILDEPTNHLDMETIEALGNALAKFKGGVVLVSHDERLIRKVCKELWVVSGGTVKSLEGGIDEYKKIVEAELVVKS